VIPYMRFDFCRFGGGHPTECLPSHYIGRPDPPPPPDDRPPTGDPPSADADGDGHLPPADCDNTNSRVHPGAPEVAGNGIDDDCDAGDRAGRIAAAVQTGWRVRGSRTRVTRLRVLDAPPGAAVDIVCHGRGCSFKGRSFAAGENGVVGLTRLFKRKLRPGATITVRITAPSAIGRYVRYTVRRGRLPELERLCVPPGTTKAARC
jgi:Putative metal-binding motif